MLIYKGKRQRNCVRFDFTHGGEFEFHILLECDLFIWYTSSVQQPDTYIQISLPVICKMSTYTDHGQDIGPKHVADVYKKHKKTGQLAGSEICVFVRVR